MGKQKRLAPCCIISCCSGSAPPIETPTHLLPPTSGETAAFICRTPVHLNCKLVEFIVQRWHTYRAKISMKRDKSGPPTSSQGTSSISHHHNNPISPWSLPVPGYRDASSQAPVQHDQVFLKSLPILPEEEGHHSSSNGYDHQPRGTLQTLNKCKLAEKVQVGSAVATPSPLTVAPSKETKPVDLDLSALKKDLEEQSKSMSKLFSERQLRDDDEKFRYRLEETMQCFNTTMNSIIECAKKAEENQWENPDG